jgi:hypothetical protein
MNGYFSIKLNQSNNLQYLAPAVCPAPKVNAKLSVKFILFYWKIDNLDIPCIKPRAAFLIKS